MQSIQHDGTDPDVHYALARVSEAASNAPSLPEHQAQGFADLAQEAYSNAIRLAPQRAAFLTSLGVFLCGQSRFAAARSVFERAVAAGAQGEKDEKAVAYANLGQLYEHHVRSPTSGLSLCWGLLSLRTVALG
jgi:Tfp pilus assembly protein PilF